MKNQRLESTMSRRVFQTADWACELKSSRCTHVKSDGHRCQRRVVIGGPLCSQHNRMVHGLRISTSTIPGAGNGVFATRSIKAGAILCPYLGEKVTTSCLNKRYAGHRVAPYSLHYTDSACDRSLASMINALFGSDGHCKAASAHNAAFESRGKHPTLVVATKDIRDGEEVFVYYGREYVLADVGKTRRSHSIKDTRPC